MNRLLRALCVALWLAVLAWAATIFYLSSLSGDTVEELNVFHLWDKLAHVLAYSAGGFLLAAALRASTRWSWPAIWRSAVLALALYGISDEWHQCYTPGRQGGDWHDCLADVIGAAAGAALLLACWRAPWKAQPAPAVAPGSSIAT